MAEGVEVDIADGVAALTFIDHQVRGEALTKLHELGGADAVKIDTGGTRRKYIVSEALATEAGLVDKPRRRRGKNDTAE
jgi:hypothetical protein